MSLMGTAKTLLTFEEFERLPDHVGKLELLKGELIESRPIQVRRHRMADRIFHGLDSALGVAHAGGEGNHLGEVLRLSGFQLGSDSWLKPDVSVTHYRQPEGEYMQAAPAIAIDVISPSDLAEDMVAKTALYFEFGGCEVWRIYPQTRHVDVYVETGARVFRGNDVITTSLLPGFAMPVKEILGE